MAKVGNLANFTPYVVASVDKAFVGLQTSHRSVLVDIVTESFTPLSCAGHSMSLFLSMDDPGRWRFEKLVYQVRNSRFGVPSDGRSWYQLGCAWPFRRRDLTCPKREHKMVVDSSSRQHPTNSLPDRELSSIHAIVNKIVTKLRHEYLSCEVTVSSFMAGNFGDAEGILRLPRYNFVGEPLSRLQLKEMLKDLVGQIAYR